MKDNCIFDARICELGEGPFWHPERRQLFWFDIVGKRLLSRVGDQAMEWQFDECVSAAGWIDHDTLLVASETALVCFDIESGASSPICALEADNPVTRSNDGRADPFGGFWIGTMGKHAEPKAGAIYRFFRGELRCLYPDITIPNSICFDTTRQRIYFADTVTGKIMRQDLDEEGWPLKKPELFVDLTNEGLNPDGSVVDAEGGVWNAQWGAGRVARYTPDGQFDRAISIAGLHSSCAAFGGKELKTLFVTSAAEGLSDPDKDQGVTFQVASLIAGLPEYRVKL